MTDWQAGCARLWGEDWIAPLSEVLSVNRRTVERWRSGAVPIPPDIARDLGRLGAIGDRHYGDILRRLARGESPEDIRADIAAMQRALMRARRDLGRYRTIPMLASI